MDIGRISVNGELRWADFDDDEEDECGLFASFLEERIEVPRCTTLSKDVFLAYSDESYVEDCEPVRALLAFIGKKVGPLDSPEMVMRMGKATLDDSSAWEYPTNALHRFFKVMVEMP